MNIDEARAKIAAAVQSIRAELHRAESESIADALDTAREFSSGPYKQAMLTAMGHPYAKRNPQPPADPSVLNLQTGDLYRSWQGDGPASSGDNMESRIYNTSEHAQWMDNDLHPDGTRFMIARPIQAAIRETVAPDRDRRIQDAIKRALAP